jgi:hypothetical protein
MSNNFPLVHICMLCARKRGQDGVWRKEVSIANSDAMLSHGLCDECREEIAKDLAPLMQHQNACAS